MRDADHHRQQPARSQALIDANAVRTFAGCRSTLQPTPDYEALVAEAVAEVAERQRQVGIALPDDGEFGRAMSSPVDYGAPVARAELGPDQP